jgi:hypothetical protein
MEWVWGIYSAEVWDTWLVGESVGVSGIWSGIWLAEACGCGVSGCEARGCGVRDCVASGCEVRGCVASGCEVRGCGQHP